MSEDTTDRPDCFGGFLFEEENCRKNCRKHCEIVTECIEEGKLPDLVLP